MKEVWVVYDEAITRDSRNGFSRSVRAFDSFEKAKKVMAERIAYYASEQSNPFGKKWRVMSSIEEILTDDYFFEDGSPEQKAESLEYFRRFLQGEAGSVEVCFDEEGEKRFYNSFVCGEDDEPMWYSGDFESYTKRPVLHGTDFVTIDINAFKMDDPDKKYYCFIRSCFEKYEVPYYFYIQMTKNEIE